jgi:alpha-tubulin suppressor-like RCC1 family protein
MERLWSVRFGGQGGSSDADEGDGLAKVKAIAAGKLHSLALTESGEVYAWGVNGGERKITSHRRR